MGNELLQKAAVMDGEWSPDFGRCEISSCSTQNPWVAEVIGFGAGQSNPKSGASSGSCRLQLKRPKRPSVGTRVRIEEARWADKVDVPFAAGAGGPHRLFL